MFEKSVISLIEERKSVRTYKRKNIEDEKINTLKEFVEDMSSDLVKFKLMELDLIEVKKMISYGMIKGARLFIVGLIDKKIANDGSEIFGYLFEKIILKATELGLGTCWLGGTFKRSFFDNKMELSDNFVVGCITPVGYESDLRSLTEKTTRFLAKSDNRKSPDELFFKNEVGIVLDVKGNKYEIPLMMLRLSPSASNKQPWIIIERDNGIDFYLKRTPGYKNDIIPMDLQRSDIGIAMSHFELAANELGFVGVFEKSHEHIKYDDLEYITTWKEHQ